MNHKELLTTMGACYEGLTWYNGQDSYKAWRSCKRGDWLLWIAVILDIDRKLIVLATCDCAELSLRFVPDGEDRPRKVIETARAWCDGAASIDDVRVAVAAVAAYVATNVDNAAAYAAAAAAAATYDTYVAASAACTAAYTA